MVEIDNTESTFSMAFMFITLESAKSFKFVSDQLTDLCFYDCSEAHMIYRDFFKGLRAAIALKAKADVKRERARANIDRFDDGLDQEADS